MNPRTRLVVTQAIAQLEAMAVALKSGTTDCIGLSFVETERGETTLTVAVVDVDYDATGDAAVDPTPTELGVDPDSLLRCDKCCRTVDAHSDGWDCVCGASFCNPPEDSAGPS